MASLVPKRKKASQKVTFYLSDDLFDLYRNNRARAKALNMTIDFTGDFHKWFLDQNNFVKQQLDQLASVKQDDPPAT